jgi:hypothetical protein
VCFMRHHRGGAPALEQPACDEGWIRYAEWRLHQPNGDYI